MLKGKKLALIGSGYMGEAILKGLMAKEAIDGEDFYIINPVDIPQAEQLAQKHGAKLGQTQNIQEADIIILAFKPQNLPEAIVMYQEHIQPGQLIISILAGINVASLEQAFPAAAGIIRTMPNLALGIGESATAFCRSKNTSDAQAALAVEIFSHLGIILEVEEDKMEIVTALSGSGPGYIYYLAEAMVEGGCALGLEKEKTLALAVQTFAGAALLLKESGAEPREMRRRISSAKGTTEAGINTMEAQGFYKAVLEGMKAAYQRTHELGESFKQK